MTCFRSDGQPLSGHTTASGNDIIFSTFTKNDEGVYECVANTVLGTVQKATDISLVGKHAFYWISMITNYPRNYNSLALLSRKLTFCQVSKLMLCLYDYIQNKQINHNKHNSTHRV